MLDGFDLGVGALLLAQRDQRVRDRMVDAIAPTWDGNETWLIMSALILLAGFPRAYGILVPAFYIPVIVMLLSLGLRACPSSFVTTARRRADGGTSCSRGAPSSPRWRGASLSADSFKVWTRISTRLAWRRPARHVQSVLPSDRGDGRRRLRHARCGLASSQG